MSKKFWIILVIAGFNIGLIIAVVENYQEDGHPITIVKCGIINLASLITALLLVRLPDGKG